MISQYKLNELYKTISRDLKIDKFESESDDDYNRRVVYSSLGKWVMQLFADRDFEEDDLNQVSKSHVNISAQDILSSYKKVDNKLISYFKDDKKFINDIESIYMCLGYINSGTYTFKYPNNRNRVNFDGNKTLVIDLDSNAQKMRGLGIWGKYVEEAGMSFSDFLYVKNDALSSFKAILYKLKFIDFSSEHGKIEIYNIERNRWDYFSDNALKNYEYFILKIDNGQDYQILRKIDNKLYSASLPTIYINTIHDGYFIHEIWRIILGLCAFNGVPAKCRLSKYSGNGIKFSFGGYIFPFFEYSILKCMTWPLNDENNINEYVTDISMKRAVIQLLKSLSIEVEGGN